MPLFLLFLLSVGFVLVKHACFWCLSSEDARGRMGQGRRVCTLRRCKRKCEPREGRLNVPLPWTSQSTSQRASSSSERHKDDLCVIKVLFFLSLPPMPARFTRPYAALPARARKNASLSSRRWCRYRSSSSWLYEPCKS